MVKEKIYDEFSVFFCKATLIECYRDKGYLILIKLCIRVRKVFIILFASKNCMNNSSEVPIIDSFIYLFQFSFLRIILSSYPPIWAIDYLWKEVKINL